MSATATARLERHSDCYRWIVDKCVLCGRRHEHDGGWLTGDPRRYLGLRLPPCHAALAYVLVEAPAPGMKREQR